MLTTRSVRSGDGVFGCRCTNCAFPCPQHLLNFLPLPQGHGSFLPVITLASNKINRLTDPTFDRRSDFVYIRPSSVWMQSPNQIFGKSAPYPMSHASGRDCCTFIPKSS